MKEEREYKKPMKFLSSFLWSVMAMFTFACSNEISEDFGESSNDMEVTVTAAMSPMVHSRAYQEEGEVEAGEYCISYPTTNNGSYNTAIVQFKYPNLSPNIGIVTIPPSSSLTWDNVQNVSQPTFYLDNIPWDKSSDHNPKTTVTFTDSYNPFKADLFDLKDGKNDLLWGSSTVNRGAKNVNFDLHHNMARLNIEVTVDKTYEQEEGDLDLDEATVEISSLILNPVSFNRLDGTLSFDENPERNSLTIVSPTEKDKGWLKREPDSDDSKTTVFTSHDFVLPPQGLPDDISRPRLTITLKNGRVYSGILPYAMEVVDSEHPEPYPMTLYFLKEHILTIRTIISENPPELIFMPVKVVEWVDKGSFSFDAHQSGIYTKEEFSKLIKYYKAKNTYQLVRYGSLKTTEAEPGGIWVFDFWRSVTLEYDDISGQMRDNEIPFRFNFNRFSIFVTIAGVDTEVDEDELYDIVTGTYDLTL